MILPQEGGEPAPIPRGWARATKEPPAQGLWPRWGVGASGLPAHNLLSLLLLSFLLGGILPSGSRQAILSVTFH